jgi:hypothetical protein
VVRQWRRSEEWASHRCVPRGNGLVLLFRSSPVNLSLRASYRHDSRGPLPTDLMITPLFKAITDLWREIRTRSDRSGLRSIQQLNDMERSTTSQDRDEEDDEVDKGWHRRIEKMQGRVGISGEVCKKKGISGESSLI